MTGRRLLGGAALLSGGALLYQAVAAMVFIAIRTTSTDADAAAFFLVMAFSQLGGAVATLNLQYHLIAEQDARQAALDASDILTLLVVITAGVTAIGWQAEIVTLGHPLALWAFMFVFAVAELMRGVHIRAERPGAAASIQLMLAAALGIGGASLGITGRASDVFWITALCALPAFFWRTPLMPGFRPLRIAGLLHRGHRFVLYRTPTTLTDFLTARGVVLIVTGLGAEFVATFFLMLRIIGLPVQIVTWGLSLLFFRQASTQKTGTSVAQLSRAWGLLTRAGLPALWALTTLALASEPLLQPLVGGGALLAPVIAAVFCYSFMLAYVGWIGRLFDTVGAQARAFVFELFGNCTLIALFWIAAQRADVATFLALWLAGHVIYNLAWSLFLFRTLGQPPRLVLRGFFVPQLLSVAGVSVIYALLG